MRRLRPTLGPGSIALVVPHVLLGGGTLLMLVLHPNAARSALMSTRAIAVSAGLAAGWLLLAFVVLPWLVRVALLRGAVLTVVAGAGIVLLVLPTLRDRTVIETFPKAASTREATAPSPTDVASSSTAAPQPVRVSTGALRGIDHDASGAASIFRQPDGRLVVALEDIDVEPGPDYFVHLVSGANREQPSEGSQIEKLRGNKGTQYYDIPNGREGTDWTVLIWCRTFGVPVANATQRPV